MLAALAFALVATMVAAALWWHRRRLPRNIAAPGQFVVEGIIQPQAPQLAASSAIAVPRVPTTRARRPPTLSSQGQGMLVAADTSQTCPSCWRHYVGQRYCTSDARRLSSPHEAKQRGRGVKCLACHRAFDDGLTVCPHDSLPLVPYSLHSVHSSSRRRGATQPAHVVARICPLCGTRDDLHARFCGRDGAVLLVIN
jgi:hypothetical protein